jgi:hypothetical protein
MSTTPTTSTGTATGPIRLLDKPLLLGTAVRGYAATAVLAVVLLSAAVAGH